MVDAHAGAASPWLSAGASPLQTIPPPSTGTLKRCHRRLGTAVNRHPEATVQLHLEPRARERRPRRRFRALVLIVHEQHMPAAADCASTIDAAPRRLVVAAVVAPQLGEEGPEGWHRQKRASFFSTITKSPQPAPRVNRKKNRDERIGR